MDRTDHEEWCSQEWTLRSVELLLGPAGDLRSLFDALAGAAAEAGLVPHTIHCEDDVDGYRLHASCDVETSPVTMDGIVRILRRREAA
jgi:hypothetical protein